MRDFGLAVVFESFDEHVQTFAQHLWAASEFWANTLLEYDDTEGEKC